MIACAIEEPSAERKAKLGSWPHCKKGEKCLYDHTNYSSEAVLAGRKKHHQIRLANRCYPPPRDTHAHTHAQHTPNSTRASNNIAYTSHAPWQDGEGTGEASDERRRPKHGDELNKTLLPVRHVLLPPVMTLRLAENREVYTTHVHRDKTIVMRLALTVSCEHQCEHRWVVRQYKEHRGHRQTQRRHTEHTDTSRPNIRQ